MIKYVKLMPDSERRTDYEEYTEYEYTLVLICTSAIEDSYHLSKDQRIPKEGSSYNLHGTKVTEAIITNREFQKIGEKVWTVKCTFSTKRDNEDRQQKPQPQQPQEDKDIKPPVISWGERTVEVYKDRDIKGNPYVNTAGEPISPPPQLKSIGILSIKTYKRAFNRSQAFEVRNKVNSDDFYGCKAGTLLAKQPTASSVYDDKNGKYWEVTYTFEHNEDGWIPTEVISQGTRCKVEDLDKNSETYHQEILVIPRDELGREFDGMVLLDKDGKQLPKGQKPHLLKFVQYDTYAFRRLGALKSILE